MVEHMTQFAFKGKREHIAKVNMPNIAYPNQHIDIKIPPAWRDYVIAPDTVKITFNLDISSTDKARSVVNNVGRALVKKRCLCWVWKTNSDIYDTCKDLYLRKKEREEKLHGIQSANRLKARVGAKADVTALTVTTQKNAINRTFDKLFAIPLFCLFSSILCIHMDLKKIWFLEFYALGIPQQHTSFQTYGSNMMQFLTNHMQQA